MRVVRQVRVWHGGVRAKRRPCSLAMIMLYGKVRPQPGEHGAGLEEKYAWVLRWEETVRIPGCHMRIAA